MQLNYARPRGTASHHGVFVAGSDQSLIEAVAQGDKRALRVLFARHNVRIYRFALRFTGNPSTAEDIVNEVFLEVWRQAAEFAAKSQVSTWMLGMARFKALSMMRRRSESQWDEDYASTVADTADNPEELTDKLGRSAILQQCLHQLPVAQREVIDLVYYHGKSVAEVAEIVDAPEKTVKTRMFYARRRLAEMLAAKNIYSACL